MENAIQVTDERILSLVQNDKYIMNMKNEDGPTGKPPTNLIKCLESLSFSFRKRIKSTYSCIIDREDVSRTILCTYGRMPRLFVPVKNRTGCFLRPYTIKELQQIQGFPSTFIFCGSYLSQVTQIGNAIPPTFIAHVMNYIKDILSGDLLEL